MESWALSTCMVPRCLACTLLADLRVRVVQAWLLDFLASSEPPALDSCVWGAVGLFHCIDFTCVCMN